MRPATFMATGVPKRLSAGHRWWEWGAISDSCGAPLALVGHTPLGQSDQPATRGRATVLCQGAGVQN